MWLFPISSWFFSSIKTQSSTRLVSKLYFSISLYSFCSCSFSLYHLFCGRAHKTSRKLRQVYEHLYTGTVRVLNFKLSNSTMFHVNVFAWLLALARFEHKLSASQGPPVLFLDGMHVTLHWSPAGAGCWNGVGLKRHHRSDNKPTCGSENWMQCSSHRFNHSRKMI